MQTTDQNIEHCVFFVVYKRGKTTTMTISFLSLRPLTSFAALCYFLGLTFERNVNHLKNWKYKDGNSKTK